MSEQVNITGGWVKLRSADVVPERLRRPLIERTAQGAQMMANMDEESADSNVIRFWNEYNDLLTVAMVSEWSFGGEVSLDSILDLPAKAYDDVQALVAPFITQLLPNFEPDADPKVITENSDV
jgi:hypothetical protein